MQKNLVILGATGSIGQQTLDVVTRVLAADFRVYGLSAHNRGDRLAELIRKHSPRKAVVTNSEQYEEVLAATAGWEGELLSGPDGLLELVTDPAVDVVVSAVVGAAGIQPTLAALQAGKKVALANKESLVAAGELIMAALKGESSAELIPVDSEHSAIFQCLQAVTETDLKQVHLTASGGPFARWTVEEMKTVTPEAALAHPTWRMGGKITIDSATLMNKGLEVIEAHWLFGLPYDRIKVVIHPQSIIHSLIELVDGSLLAQLGPADMRLPIQYALTYPERKANPFSRLDLYQLSDLQFYPPDFKRFPCLELAYAAGKAGGVLPTVLNAANEEAVYAFLGRRIGFLAIPRLIERAMNAYERGSSQSLDLDTILAVDAWTRRLTRQFIARESG
ncbi:1-deoxy-D-xylulose-5-phosphate reductoisomerase [Capillibacterium thermochitinicola]|uniref:1-deoxy-D-xylulose 5-phosphate reductoisomerase n=1 Tax=Capillibacterium thermochitinicola TaxID=2699427 RepID=A0A8J6HZP9_9FIRM|nr:1-deoxy-D-xylulose-5-phosphate reductoisomerase [Capillibacterium thermochitinicola]MBA2132791.1 1-deoxy-D-xylulose-5-phosphate reductoisomerase [Capillibacterium thermochitinicola]